MKNKKYTIKYSKPNHSNTNTNTNTPTHEAQLTNTHPLIKTSICKAIATCLTFSLVVSIVGYAQALNKTGKDNTSTLSETEISSPHYIAIKNFQTHKENYWDINNIGNVSPDRIFYVDMSKMVENNAENNDEPVYIFSDMSVQYSEGQISESKTSEPEHTEPKTSTYRYAYLIHLTDSERYTVYSVLAGEVGNASYRDKLLVAQCFYDGLVYNKCTPKQLANSQYDGYKDFNKFKEECIKCNKNYYEDIVKAVEEVFDKGNVPVDEFILYFYGYKGYTSKWHETQKLVEQTDVHKYFAQWKEPQI
jgi:hypothetical protein